MSRAHRADHGRRHRRARVPGARARAPAARARRTRSSGSARSAASRRASCRRTNIPIEWLVDRAACAARALLTLLAAPFRLAPSLWQALRVDAPAPARASWSGFGGFVTGPGGVAAWLTRRAARDPRAERDRGLHQPLARAARARSARSVSRAAFRAGVKARVVGNPVRAEIVDAAAAAERFAQRSGAMRLLVFGGSQGAARLNAVVPFARRAGSPERRRSRCATRPASAASTPRAQRYARGGRDAPRSRRSSTTWPRPTLGGPRDLPRRRAHGLGARGRRRRRRSSCRFPRPWTITRRATRSSSCAKARPC